MQVNAARNGNNPLDQGIGKGLQNMVTGIDRIGNDHVGARHLAIVPAFQGGFGVINAVIGGDGADLFCARSRDGGHGWRT